MSIASRIKGRAFAAFLGPAGRGARDLVAEARRRIAGDPVRLELFHDPGDPWSYLAAQAFDRLVAAYPGVEIAVHAISAPTADVAPTGDLRARHAVRDARELAAYWDVAFPGKREADPTLLRKVQMALVRDRPVADQLRACLALGDAMWSGDGKRVDALLGEYGAESQSVIAPTLATSYAALRDRGHYQGAMIAYRGEWYWGIDRLRYLEAALAADTGRPAAGVVAPRPEAERGALAFVEDPKAAAARGPGAPLVMDAWFSFRSPYSYLALERIEDVIAGAPVELRLRPVLPSVDRGMAMPQVKRMYIARDAQREADRLGIPFGALCEPRGAAIPNCLAIAKWAQAEGALLPFARSALRAAWAEALDLSSYVDLRRVVERAGLAWDGAKAAIADATAATSWATSNAADLAVAGLWGVPSFRIGDLTVWGQDRLDLIADRLRRHKLASQATAAS
jgi:2-hydroxychromene-2-carboxylate isomerase